MPKGEPVAFTEFGMPTIVRQVDGDSGQARTIVQNEDGSHKVFGANTITSLTTSADMDAKRWLRGLNNREMHGLVHELGKRLVGASQMYTHRRTVLERMAQRGHFEFFGLKQGFSEKELHAAYRRMAKRMHPDKNGGTEEAKRKFQHMKERYESLKEQFRPTASGAAGGSSGAAGGNPGGGDDEEDQSGVNRDEERQDNMEEGGDGASGDRSSGGDGSAAEEAEADGADEEQRSPSTRRSRARSRRSSSDVSGDSPNRRRGSSSATPKEGGGGRREAYDEDDDDAGGARRGAASNDGARISYDPTDRASMDDTVWRMLRQMRRLQQGLDSVSEELRRAGGGGGG